MFMDGSYITICVEVSTTDKSFFKKVISPKPVTKITACLSIFPHFSNSIRTLSAGSRFPLKYSSLSSFFTLIILFPSAACSRYTSNPPSILFRLLSINLPTPGKLISNIFILVSYMTLFIQALLL